MFLCELLRIRIIYFSIIKVVYQFEVILKHNASEDTEKGLICTDQLEALTSTPGNPRAFDCQVYPGWGGGGELEPCLAGGGDLNQK